MPKSLTGTILAFTAMMAAGVYKRFPGLKYVILKRGMVDSSLAGENGEQVQGGQDVLADERTAHFNGRPLKAILGIGHGLDGWRT